MLKLFAGSTHTDLSRNIADYLGVALSQAEVVRFDNSECRVRIVEPVFEIPTAIIQPLSNPTDQALVELMLFVDALRRSGSPHVTAIIPYFGYARQDVQHREGEAVSFSVLVNILEHVGINRFIVCDIHDEASKGVFMTPLQHVTLLPKLAEKVRSYLGEEKDNVAIVSADHSGIERARTFGTAYFGHTNFDVVVTEKKRNLDGIHDSHAVDIYGDVKGKTAIVVDDIATSAKTLVNSAQLCLDSGATRAIGAVVHHDFSESAPRLIQDSRLEVLFTTNTIPLWNEWKFEKHREVDISDIIGKEVRAIVEG